MAGWQTPGDCRGVWSVGLNMADRWTHCAVRTLRLVRLKCVRFLGILDAASGQGTGNEFGTETGFTK